jgi:hypothetical protein
VPVDIDTERTDSILNSFTFHQVSQLEKDTSTALATIRESRNSFIPINRVPLDVLSLIPTHLSSQRDRLRASFVCRHWRRTFLQRAELWSQLFLSKGEAYVKTLLERAKGSALDIIVDRQTLVSTMALLSPHTEQIRDLGFSSNDWADIQDFSEANPRPLAFLRDLSVNIGTGLDIPDYPPLPLFTHLANMKAFRYHSKPFRSPSFRPFVFPNLVSFEFSTTPAHDFLAYQLLDFLDTSPMLRTVDMRIIADISLDGVPQGKVVVLPNVETFNLAVSDGEPGYKTATHIS